MAEQERPGIQPVDREPERDQRTGRAAAAERINHQAHWVEQQLRVAQARGDFDNLPGAGKPIEDLGAEHDPDWGLKKLVERERISVLPPALALRVEDARLDGELDLLGTQQQVRDALDDFNARVRRARMQLEGGPPVITPLRDVDAEVTAWRGRRTTRVEAQSEQRSAARAAQETPQRRRSRWWRRRR
jgi:hypothetical protein